MNDARIEIDIATVRLDHVGPATGEIWLAVGQLNFPAVRWNDFVVVILEAWTAALLRLVRGVSTSERVHFMEGPYEVDLALTRAGVVQLRASERGQREKAIVEVRLGPLVTSVVESAAAVLEKCRQRDVWSRDSERLEAGLIDLQQQAPTVLREDAGEDPDRGFREEPDDDRNRGSCG